MLGNNASSSIEPASFTPLSPGHHPGKRPLKVAVVVVTLVVLFIAVVLWFLFSSRALVISAQPADADITISGGLVVPVANSHLALPGEYEISASAQGYYPATQTVTVSKSGDTVVALNLEKTPGALQVNSEIKQVAVVIDGESRGHAPGIIDNIPAGVHEISLQHPRYRPKTLTLEFQGMAQIETLQADLEPAWGSVTIETTPPGASITVAEHAAGITPATIDVLETGESVSLQLAGYKTWQKTLSPTPAATAQTMQIALEPAGATLNLVSTPAGARVTVNGDYHGQTPTTIALDPGRQQRIVLFLAGYEKATRNLKLESGESRSMTVNLAPEFGKITLRVEPADARVFVDGKPAQPQQGVLTLPSRPHKIEARRTDYVSASQTVTPKPGIEQLVNLKLVKASEAEKLKLPMEVKAANGQTLKRFPPQKITFATGSSRREQGRRANEIQRDVALERLFYVATTPVTNAQFKKFQELHSSSHAKGKTLDTPTQPVVNISWQEAALYCNWLSEQEGLPQFYQVKAGKITGNNPQSTGYRLPTETEWAWLARYQNGGMARFRWGDQFPPPNGAGNFADDTANGIAGRILSGYQDGFAVSAPVAHFSANDKGLYDLGHNVAEWVHDHYGAEPNLGTRTEVDTLGPESGEYHVIRGASWQHGTITELRLSFRDYGNDKRNDVGFRVARYALEGAP